MKEEYLDNLVVLEFAQNNCYPKVITAKAALSIYSSLQIDVYKKIWSYNKNAGNIGLARFVGRNGGNEEIIGIYDRRKTKDLDQMVHDWDYIRNEAGRASVYMD